MDELRDSGKSAHGLKLHVGKQGPSLSSCAVYKSELIVTL